METFEWERTFEEPDSKRTRQAAHFVGAEFSLFVPKRKVCLLDTEDETLQEACEVQTKRFNAGPTPISQMSNITYSRSQPLVMNISETSRVMVKKLGATQFGVLVELREDSPCGEFCQGQRFWARWLGSVMPLSSTAILEAIHPC
jgi:hypothetical protein